MFNKDTDLIFEAYRTQTVEEGKMKDIATAIEMGDDVDEIIKDLKLDDTEEIRNYITKERDDFYEKGERADAIDSEDMESCSEEDEPDDEKKEKQRAGLAHARAVADHYEDDPEEDAERCPITGKLRKKSQDEEDSEPSSEEDEIDDPSVANDMVKALQDIANELRSLNQYVDFMSTGTRTRGGSRAAAQPIDGPLS
tara:strand:+ start:7230 stop:7820 length:591 start_codon:yes stop_codon:yes gene_type:complete